MIVCSAKIPHPQFLSALENFTILQHIVLALWCADSAVIKLVHIRQLFALKKLKPLYSTCSAPNIRQTKEATS